MITAYPNSPDIEKALMKAQRELASPHYSEDPDYHYTIGNEMFFKGLFREARRRFAAALRLEPMNDFYKQALLRAEEEICKQKERERQEKELAQKWEREKRYRRPEQECEHWNSPMMHGQPYNPDNCSWNS